MIVRLTAEARKLIAELGSSHVDSIGYRDSWAFVGGKGASVKSRFEKVTPKLITHSYYYSILHPFEIYYYTTVLSNNTIDAEA